MSQHPGSEKPRIPLHRCGWVQLALLIVLSMSLGACTSAKHYRAAGGTVVRDNPRVLLMPPDVLVLEVTTAGIPIPRADWSARAQHTLLGVTNDAVHGRGGVLVPYQRPDEDSAISIAEAHLPALRLYQTVLQTILTYRYGGGGQGRPPELVTKGREGLSWTLGNTVVPLRAKYNADYALFLTYRQASSNAGRAMLSAAAFVLFGAISTTSQSVGLATLVDLHTGEVVWTNLLSGQAVEVGEPEGLREKGLKLLQGWPL